MNPEVDALKQFFAAINRNDMQAITRNFDPQIVRIKPEGFPTAGTYQGIAAVQEHVRTGQCQKHRDHPYPLMLEAPAGHSGPVSRRARAGESRRRGPL